LITREPINITKGLVIAPPWISLILNGQKDWEMRAKATEHRGWFALIWKGMGAVYGVARLVDVGLPLDIEQMTANFERHRIPNESILAGEVAAWNTPWMLDDVIRLPKPVPYKHPSGAVTWVRLEESVTQAIEDQLRLLSPPPPVPEITSVSTAPAYTSIRIIGETEVTQGNIDHNHFYLRSFIDRFPADLVGGSNKSQLARRVATVHWDGGEPVVTDIDGSKKFFRSRGWIASFFRMNGASPGDKVVIEEVAPYQYRVACKKRA
jgi:hypothetical protein